MRRAGPAPLAVGGSASGGRPSDAAPSAGAQRAGHRLPSPPAADSPGATEVRDLLRQTGQLHPRSSRRLADRALFLDGQPDSARVTGRGQRLELVRLRRSDEATRGERHALTLEVHVFLTQPHRCLRRRLSVESGGRRPGDRRPDPEEERSRSAIPARPLRCPLLSAAPAAATTWDRSTWPAGRPRHRTAQTTTAGAQPEAARMLRRIVDGEVVCDRNPSKQDAPAVGALENMRCIESTPQRSTSRRGGRPTGRRPSCCSPQW